MTLISPDISLSSSDDSVSGPFGPEWPAKNSKEIGSRGNEHPPGLSSSTLRPNYVNHEQLPPASNKPKPKETVGSPFNSKDVLNHITSQQSALPPLPTVSSQSLSKRSKENVTTKSAQESDLDPPIRLPLSAYSYKDQNPPPTRLYVRNKEEANELVGKLSGAVGFDLEWKVIFSRGSKARPVATVQLSDRRTIIIIQISAMKTFPTKLKELLEDAAIAKIGANILNDGKKLARDYGVRPQGLVELGGLAQQADVHFVERYFRASDAILRITSTNVTSASKKRKPGKVINLATITTMYTGRALSKGPVRISDWELQPLSEAQLEYAANDAHSALIVYQRLLEMAKAADVVLDPGKYTSRVADYSFPSKTVTKTTSQERLPAVQAPALLATPSSSSSTSTSTRTSEENNHKGSSISTSTSSSVSVVRTSDAVRLACSTSRGTSPIFPVLRMTAKVTCNGIGKGAEYRETGRSVAQRALVNVSRPNEEVARGRPGPRFKPSYNNFPRPTSEPSSPSSSKISRTLAPNNPSPERSARFKPSYNTTNSSSSSSEKKSIDTPPLPRPSSTSIVQPLVYQPTNQRPQHIRAYNLWHIRQFPLPEICSTLRSRDNPLKASTVITYVVSALQTDPRLHFSRDRLKALLASESSSWMYYRDWFHTLNVKKYVNMDVGIGTQARN